MTEIAAKIGKALGPLLFKRDFFQTVKIAGKKIPDMVFVHVGAHVSVIPVPENGNIVKENIRALETQLIEPAVLGNNIF